MLDSNKQGKQSCRQLAEQFNSGKTTAAKEYEIEGFHPQGVRNFQVKKERTTSRH